MSDQALYVIVRDGHIQYYLEDHARETHHRELVWGPEAFEDWVVKLPELSDIDDFPYPVVIVNFNSQLLSCRTDADALEIPKVAALYNRLLTTAWPGYEVAWITLDDEVLLALGRKQRLRSPKTDFGRIEFRTETIADAAGLDDDDDDDEEYYEYDEDSQQDGDSDLDPTEFEATELRAWITIVGSDGSIEHRQLSELPMDLLQAKPDAVERLSDLPACEVPAEAVVREGMWIDVRQRTVSFWGGASAQTAMPFLEAVWKGWDVQWASRGYAQHCAATGPSGQPLSTEAALALLVPTLLSTSRPGFENAFAVMGNVVKRVAVKATGCLLVVICLPVLIFGAVSGSWKAVGITVGITVGLVALIFKLIEWKIRKSFSQSVLKSEIDGEMVNRSAAGPLDQAKRRAELDKLLAAAGLPPLSKIASQSSR